MRPAGPSLLPAGARLSRPGRGPVFTQGCYTCPALPHDRGGLLGGQAVEVQGHLGGPLHRGRRGAETA